MALFSKFVQTRINIIHYFHVSVRNAFFQIILFFFYKKCKTMIKYHHLTSYLFVQKYGQNLKLGSINTGSFLSCSHYFIWLYVFNFPCFSWPVNSKKTVVSFGSNLNTNVQNLMCFVYFVVGKKRSKCHSLLHYYPTV